MFGFFASQEKKTRAHAANWLELADKVWHFRRDQLSPQDNDELLTRSRELRQQLKARADAARLKLGIEALEGVLRRTGGALYPKSSLVENVEFFLVAAIVILGIRTYFVQPFKIPTNSMWPTYYGMTAENLPPDRPAPALWQQALRFLAFGAQRRTVVAPASGEVTAEFDENTGAMAYQVRNGRNWLILPAQVKEYTFLVNGRAATVTVPLDFNEFDRVVADTFFGGESGFLTQFLQTRQARAVRRQRGGMGSPEDYSRNVRLTLKQNARAGDPILRFDILTGDQLFVDRVSYHFVKPKVGQGFVFRTGHIAGIGDDQYYIKRLVGLPGDVLEIKEPTLYRNGAPITGAESFRLNAQRVPPYRGYFNAQHNGYSRNDGQYLLKGQQVTVPENSFMALGDNSGSSLDGRYWGFVPDKDAIGRPLVIYYPFTRRWGWAR
ncbi:signal peptidase I [Opitutus terrae]|uniref:Signal peptidase I n=1 Tax=Opitutus terrae (strain DSM 11246 / JCM 15787 / PB90-1) TaxID=452637 RepID=B1ZN24_OPITP|nr:signal peptidase I [Opitutus terrae]ACB76476.1 signal peptidase I [Opitutus terrae PB90-1]